MERIQDRLVEIQIPHTYDAVVVLVRDVVSLYEELIDEIGRQEGFKR